MLSLIIIYFIASENAHPALPTLLSQISSATLVRVHVLSIGSLVLFDLLRSRKLPRQCVFLAFLFMLALPVCLIPFSPSFHGGV